MKEEELSSEIVFLEHLQPKFKGLTIFHQFSLNTNILKLIQEEI
jgi:hypothetical protein